MDHAIRQLLLKSERDFDGKSLDDAFEKLKRGRKDVSDQTEPFSSDLFVICAQTALKVISNSFFFPQGHLSKYKIYIYIYI